MKAKTNMTMLCDFYELTMGNGYFQTGLTDRICYLMCSTAQSPTRRLCHCGGPGPGGGVY